MRQVVSGTMEVNDVELTIDGYVVYHSDNNYGADADGNRGEKRTIIDDVVGITAYNRDMDDVKLSTEQLEQAATILTREFLEE